MIDITPEGVATMANALVKAGVAIPKHAMSVDDIHAEIAERDAVKRERTKTALLVALVVGLMVAGLVALAIAFG